MRPDQLVDDPHLIESGGLVDMQTDDGGSTEVVLLPLLMGGRRPGVRRPLPQIGEHTEEVLAPRSRSLRLRSASDCGRTPRSDRRQHDSSISRRAVLALAAARCSPPPASMPRAAARCAVILPVGAGSGVDTIMRAAQTDLSKALGGQPVVIENLPGAGGITGTQAIVKAAPDGNTIGVISNNHAVNPSVYKKIPYDSLKDITPISVVGSTPFVLVVNPAKVPAKNAKELQALLKAKPGAYNYASSGNGTIIHLAGEMFLDAADVDVKHIPYKGVGPMIADLIGGQVDSGVVAASVQGT